jgi:branched-chain amino acid transport system permease protein
MSGQSAPAEITGFFRRQESWHWYDGAFWLGVGACYFIFPGNLVLISQILITGLFALSLDLILGYGGIVSLGHAAFFGLGAYAAGLLAANGWHEPISGLLAAGAAAGLLGLLTSFVVVRLHGIALLMVTMGIALVLHEIAQKARAITGGDDGLQGVRFDPLLGLFRFDMSGHTAFIYTLIVVLLCFVAARRIVLSPFGMALRGLRENGRRLPAIGVSVGKASATIYTIAAVLAGIAGGLLAQTTAYVSVEVLSFERSAEVLIMLILGGAGRLYGGLIGAAVFLILRDRFADVSPQYWFFWLGLILVIVVLFARGGLLAAAEALLRRLRRGPGQAPGKASA